MVGAWRGRTGGEDMGATEADTVRLAAGPHRATFQEPQQRLGRLVIPCRVLRTDLVPVCRQGVSVPEAL